MSSVEVKGLSVRAGARTLISDVTLDFEPGTWSTIIGPNGAGKTTLVETIAGLRRPSLGSVSILGEALADHVEADEDEAVGAQAGTDGAHHLALAGRELGGLDAAADVDVGAQVVPAGDAEDGAEGRAPSGESHVPRSIAGCEG